MEHARRLRLLSVKILLLLGFNLVVSELIGLESRVVDLINNFKKLTHGGGCEKGRISTVRDDASQSYIITFINLSSLLLGFPSAPV